MNFIYLDTLFLINFITDYLILICTAKVSGATINRKRFIVSAIIGSIYACLCVYYKYSWINEPAIKLSAAIFICLFSFGNETNVLRCYITFFLISALLGGILSGFVTQSSQGNYIPINIKVLLITFTSTYFILSLWYRNYTRTKGDNLLSVEICLRNQCVSLTVLKDTGNELYDPISNLPVMIIEKTVISEILPEITVAKADIYDLFYELSQIDSLKGKFRLIPFQTIHEKGILLGVIPDSVKINGQQVESIIACTEMKLSETNQYQGIC